MKWGSKYGYEYVNRLNKSIKKHTKRSTQLYCFTDSPNDIDKDINVNLCQESLCQRLFLSHLGEK